MLSNSEANAVMQTRFCRWLSLVIAVLSLAVIKTPNGLAQSQTADKTAIENDSPTVVMGLQGKWKVGFETIAKLSSSNTGLLAMTTVDGDGVAVTYQMQSNADKSAASLPPSGQLLVRHGRSNRAMSVTVTAAADQKSNQKLTRQLTPAERGTPLPIDQPWIVTLGENVQLEAISQESGRGGLPSISISSFESATDLPAYSQAYGGVDAFVVATDRPEILDQLSPAQAAALVEWVDKGGRIQIWLGGAATAAANVDWLKTLLPAEVIGVAAQVDPGLLESYVASSQGTRLSALDCAILKPMDAKVDLTLISQDRKRLPFLMRSAYGAGYVDVIATDINSESLLDWRERRVLLERTLLSSGLRINATPIDSSDAEISRLGYSTVAGQIRASLDSFDLVWSGSITLIAVFITLFLIIVGPLDFFFMRGALHRSAYTWLTLLVTTLAITAIGQVFAWSWKPDQTVVNSFEVIDYHFDTATAHGQAFLHQYSGHADRFTTSVATASQQETYLRWSGQPGVGLGGFDSQVRTDLGMPKYEINYRQKNRTANSRKLERNDLVSEIVDIGVPTAGTATLRTSWTEDCETMVWSNQLANIAGSDVLEGSFTNPLDSDLINAVMMYSSWAYPLPERIAPGESVTFTLADSPKDLRRQLQQRRLVKDREQSIPWDPTQVRNLERLINLMSFYSVAGGRQYVGLDLEYLQSFDWSNRLELNRAVLVGQLDKPIIEVRTSTSAQRLVTTDGYRSAYARFLLPVVDR